MLTSSYYKRKLKLPSLRMSGCFHRGWCISSALIRRLLPLAILSIVGIPGCSSAILEAPNEVSPTLAASTDFSKIPGQYPQPAISTAYGQESAPVGGCVNVGGTQVRATISVVDCGSSRNTYRVIQRVNVPNECIGDSDRRLYQNSKADGQWTACLDLAWDSASCISISAEVVAKVDCDDKSTSRKFKPIKVIYDSTTLDSCTSGGYTHPIRRFTICTQPQP